MNKNIVSIKGTPYGLVFYFDTTQAGFGQVCAALEEKLLHSGDFFINAEYIIDQPSVFSEEELAIIEGILKMYMNLSKEAREKLHGKLLSHNLRDGRKRVMSLIRGL